MILKVFLRNKILGDILVEYLGNISGKNLRGITREISGQYFWKNLRVITGEIFVGYFDEDFGGNIDHYILFVDINSQTNILKQNLKFILNLEGVWENFKIWIFGMLHFWGKNPCWNSFSITEKRYGKLSVWPRTVRPLTADRSLHRLLDCPVEEQTICAHQVADHPRVVL
jgi:hypothetical protein